MNISLIAAYTTNNILGNKNKLIWKLPTDMSRFKQITEYKIVIMGKNTYNSIGKPLPNRNNIVITTSNEIEDVFVLKQPALIGAESIQKALYYAKSFAEQKDDKYKEIMIIGGQKIYEQFLPLANKMYLSKININAAGDTFFPYFNENEWRVTHKEFIVDKDSFLLSDTNKTPLDYTYSVYER